LYVSDILNGVTSQTLIGHRYLKLHFFLSLTLFYLLVVGVEVIVAPGHAQ